MFTTSTIQSHYVKDFSELLLYVLFTIQSHYVKDFSELLAIERARCHNVLVRMKR